MQGNKVITFLSLWVLNSLLFVIFDQVFGENMVLGNDKVVAPMASIFSGLILALVVFAVDPIVKKSGFKTKDPKILFFVYLVANFVGIWGIKFLERLSGVGISSSLYVAVFALVANFAQWGVVEYVVPMLGGKKAGK